MRFPSVTITDYLAKFHKKDDEITFVHVFQCPMPPMAAPMGMLAYTRSHVGVISDFLLFLFGAFISTFPGLSIEPLDVLDWQWLRAVFYPQWCAEQASYIGLCSVG